MDAPYSHIPVLADQVLTLLAPRPGDTAVDGTVGLGGHAGMVGEKIGDAGKLICFDRDIEALTRAEARLKSLPCQQIFINQSFETMERELRARDLAPVHRILMDLGVSSLQLDKPERGFSFMRDGPLDMRMNQAAGLTAADIVNSWPAEKLEHLFKTFGEERFSRRLAKSIVEARASQPIKTTGELSRLAEASAPRLGKTHPATRMFQALRLEVNDELGGLSRGLAGAGKVLAPGGRLAVITFHSLEDRLVKRTFAKWRDLGLVRLVTPKAVACDRAEARENRRARSAKLRVVERI